MQNITAMEADRLRALASFAILDTGAEPEFDEITRLASMLLSVPSSVISLIDADRQWFKARVGVELYETPRDIAFCAHAVASNAFLEISDASLDSRFAHNPLVTRENGIRFYAGAPLIVASGQCLGTLCVFDSVPREPLSAGQRQSLQDLANLAVERIEARRVRLHAAIAAEAVAVTSDAVLALGQDGTITFWNAAAERMFGHKAARALGSTLDLILPPTLAAAHHSGFRRATAGGPTTLVGHSVEVSARRASGEEFPIELSLACLPADTAGGGGFAAIVRDISSRRALENERADAQLFLDSIVMHLPAILFAKDSETRRYVLLNKAGEDMLGRSASEVIGRTDEELALPGCPQLRERDERALSAPGSESYESDFPRPDGGIAKLRTKRILIETPGMDRRYILGLSDDITDLRQSEKTVLHLAHHDSLTGLLNRASLLAQLEVLVAEGRPLAVLTIDLDRFKAVNDQFGHLTGDRLLIEAGDRLRRSVGAQDIVARIGGDEFVIIALDPDPAAHAERIANAVVTALAEPYAIDRFIAHAGGSIGVVLSPGDGASVEELRQAADLALYRAKASGRGSIRYYNVKMDAEVAERRALEVDLRAALEHEMLEVAYQPIVACATGQVTSFEALARWTHPVHGAISPEVFIGIAEESGMIGMLGDHVLQQACNAAAHWPDNIRIAVNLSPLQFENNDLVATVHAALTTSGLPAQRLQLEVTEGLVIRDVEKTFRILTELRALGVQILLDDFGVGYSSLSYFERFPFDKVKIDRSFVAKLATTPAARAIVQAVVGLGQTLGIGVVAEGVETTAQMQMLIEIGCTHLQGYLFSRPMPEAAFAHIVGHANVFKKHDMTTARRDQNR